MNTFVKHLILALVSLIVFGLAYPLAMVGIGQLISNHAAEGKPIYRNDTLVGYENIGQEFTSRRYFHGRPSAVNYDASSTGGSNLGPTNPEFLAMVQERIDTILFYNQGLTAEEIPVELVTASGSGLDPHISVKAAKIQVSRIAATRGIEAEKLENLIAQNTEEPLWGIAGPGQYINVLKLNIELDKLK